MKDQPWDLNQTWPVGRKWCRFTNAPQKCREASQKNLGRKNIKFLTTFFATSALDTAYLRYKTSHWQTKMLMSVYNVSHKSLFTFRDLWFRNGWDPFAYFEFLTHPLAAVTLQASFLQHV